MAAILVVGAAFRFYGINWDANHHLHPDERAITSATVELGVPPLEEWRVLLDPDHSPLNPRFFAYGSLPLYVVRASAEVAKSLAAPLAGISPQLSRELGAMSDYDHITLLGRALSAVFDLITVYLTYALARKVYDRREIGLLAAALVAFTVFHIQVSHFYAVDTFLTTFVVATCYFAVSYAQAGRRRDALYMGLAFGAALATKVSVAPLGLAVLAALVARHRGAQAPFRGLVASSALVLFVAGAAFFLGEPYAILDFPNFLEDVVEQGEMVQGIRDYPYTRQYVDTLPYLYHLTQSTLWAMGPPLGLVAWGGLLLALRGAWTRPRREELILLAWALPYFLVTGSFFVKFLRYLLPLFPVLYVFGAHMLLSFKDWVAARAGPGRVRWAGAGWLVVGGVVATGLLYSLAFLSIYSRPHSRIVASEWIYRQVPAGATLAEEHWDDNLPLGMVVDGESRSIDEYRTVSMDLYELDNPDKYQHILDNLRASDFIVLSSNRLYGSIPKSPLRYPLTTRYYELLFAERLGFRLARTFTSYPGLLGLTLVDDGADESFTVYDHPKVLIYEKVRAVSQAELDELFAAVRDGNIPQGLRAIDRRGKNLLLDRPVDTLPVAEEAGGSLWTHTDPWISIIVWWLVVQSMSLAALPLTSHLLRALPSGAGYIFSKSVGLLAVAYLVWRAASLRWAPNAAGSAWLALLIVGALSVAIYRRHGPELRRGWSEGRRVILVSELVFTVAFLYLLGLRMLNPDLWQPWNGGEKPMEFAFLNAILKSAHFPPYDPYFAHGYINYYYYGLYLVAVLIKLSGVAPSVAFNLAVPTLFALCASHALALAYALTQRLWAGLAGAIFVALLGNLDGAAQLVQAIVNSKPLVFDYWRSSRVIPFTINEFPYWSYLFADLHPHMIGIPFTILVLALAYALLRRGPRPAAAVERQTPPLERLRGLHLSRALSWGTIGLYLATALALGAVSVINTWDLPTYALLLAGAFLLAEGDLGAWRAWRRAAARAAAVVAISLILYWPFFAHYQPLHVGLGLVQLRSELLPFLGMWGAWLFILLSYLLSAGYGARSVISRPWALGAGASLGLLVALLLATGEAVLALLLPTLGLAGYVLLTGGREAASERYLRLMIFLGLGILLGTEAVFLRDFLGGSEYQRMNTLFKFYIQAWVLLALAAAAALPRLWEGVRARRPPLGWVWMGAAGTLLLGAAIFPLWGTPARVADRFPGPRPPRGTLDGLAFMSVGSYSWPDPEQRIELRYDYEAIRWFQLNVEGTPVVAEAPVGYYRELGTKVASFTGLPTLLGMHQSEQRWDWQVGERSGDASSLYETSDPQRAMDLIRLLRVSYVYVGQLEQILYPPQALTKFEELMEQGLLELAYENPQVRVYRVLD